MGWESETLDMVIVRYLVLYVNLNLTDCRRAAQTSNIDQIADGVRLTCYISGYNIGSGGHQESEEPLLQVARGSHP
jgi:hypothetical protein